MGTLDGTFGLPCVICELHFVKFTLCIYLFMFVNTM